MNLRIGLPIFLCTALLLAACSSDKVETKKTEEKVHIEHGIVGTWERSQTQGGVTFGQRMEFAPDGKWTLSKNVGGHWSVAATGTFRLPDDTHVEINIGRGPENSQIVSVSTTELVLRDGARDSRFRRVP